MDLALDDSVVLVAGSSRGIGLAIASRLLDEHARVVVTGRDPGALAAARDTLAARAGADRVLAVAGDLSRRDTIEHVLERTSSTFGRVDHLIANLGSGAGTTGWDVPADEWNRVFEHNFFASTRLTEAVLPHLLAQRSGSLLYIASIVALEATPAPLAYSAAKAALVNYANNLARQLGPNGVRVNTVAPGNVVFSGGSWARRLEENRNAVESMLTREVPLQRLGTPDEIASLAAWLCSPLAAFATGGCYVVDGGQTRSR